MTTPIIGVSGQAGVGKDTLATYLVDRRNFVRVALADPMKRIAKTIYDFSDEQLWGPSECRNAQDLRYPRDPATITHQYPQDCLSPRLALQVLGTEFGRTCYINTWVEMALRDAKTLLSGGYYYTAHKGVRRKMQLDGSWPDDEFGYDGVVIPDCRFKNEIEAIHKVGGKVIRLRRATSADALKVGATGHASEAEQMSIPDSEFDLVIDAVNGVENFYAQLDKLLPSFLTAP